MIEAAAFYLFAAVMLLSAVVVITARNPVHSVLFLVLAFFNAAGLFILLGAEFVAMILVIVYVGAVAVLFLFVVMMLDISFTDLRKGAMKFAPLGVALGALLLTELVILYNAWLPVADSTKNAAVPIPDPAQVENTKALGNVLYTEYFFAFQVSGLVLLVAMIGAIVLTHRTRPGVRRQKIADQVARQPGDVIDIQTVTPGSGA
jgi:NADH-quinone oxidoreductase subunit J